MLHERFSVRFAFLFCLLASGTIFAASPDTSLANSATRLNRAYFKGYVRDAGSIVTSPADWHRNDWLVAGGLIGADALLYTRDGRIETWAQRRRDSSTDKIAKAVKPLGDGKYTLPALAALYLYGHWGEDSRARRTALLGAESFFLSGVFTGVLKDLGHRHRPSSGDPYHSWDGPGLSSQNQSFPSGHSTVAFAVMTVVAVEYGDHAWVPPVAYGLAGLTALSRVNDNAHWASDVLMGSAVGYLTSRAILSRHQPHLGAARLSLLPPGGSHWFGLGITLAR